MRRRDFLGAAAATIFAPQFGRWYPRQSGILTSDIVLHTPVARYPSTGKTGDPIRLMLRMVGMGVAVKDHALYGEDGSRQFYVARSVNVDGRLHCYVDEVIRESPFAPLSRSTLFAGATIERIP